MNALKNQQKIGEANGMLNLPIVPTQVTLSLRRNVGSLYAPIAAQLFTFVPRGQGKYCTERVINGLKKSAENRGNQWYARSAHCAYTGNVKRKCGFTIEAQLFTFGP